MSKILMVLKREFFINTKLTYSTLPRILIMAALLVFFRIRLDSLNLISILFPALNLLYPMVYLGNIYLQQSKDKELQFILSLPVHKNSLVAGKVLYIVVLISVFNVIIHSVFLSLFSDKVVFINSLLLNCFIGIIVGMTSLTLFLFSSFETFINLFQYLRIATMLSVFLFFGLARYVSPEFDRVLAYNPAYSIIMAITIYIFYKIVVIQFKRKRSYL